jgi:S-DNA-T family DNA segregation ATPase FtsK/SpoIIIE
VDNLAGGGLRFHRPARAWPLSVEAAPILLPPVPAARQGAGAGRWQMLLPVVGSLAMVGFAFVVRSLLYLIVIGLMVVSMVGATLGAQMAGNREEKRRWANTKKRYLELISGAADESSRASGLQLAGLAGLYPGPDDLLGLTKAGEGIWERRRSDPDFGWARLGLGAAAAARPVRLGDHGPSVTEPDPDLAVAAERVVATSATIPSAPVTVPLARLGVLAVVAPGAENLTRARAMVTAWLASLAALHAPGDLRIAGLFPAGAAASWDWLKWLPHCRALQGGEGFGRARRSVTTAPNAFAEFSSDLVRMRLERPRGAGAGDPSQLGWEHVVIVVDGWGPARSNPALDTLMTHGPNVGVSVIVVVNGPDEIPSASGATAAFADDGTLLYVEGGPAGRVEAKVQPDQMAPTAALDIARRLAPLRLGWEGSSSALADSVRLCELLGAEGPAEVARTTRRVSLSDVASASGRQRRELLRVPVGRDEAGNAVELDLKEAASGGMGPHGIMVGATGSGKSELLRSITAALAARHEPGLVNLLLVDFKGGAAFAGLEPLPHVAGLVTNLAEEPDLIARVKAALAGELERRQRLLRDAGDLSSISEYHVRQAGASGELEPLPYLVVVVDEFGELLEAEPGFADIFNAIGRMGRSLGVHLLLATQRLDEGRVRSLEPHLRYRLALRTFSASESRSVLGSAAAYELPPVPGLGYLAVDELLTMFKAAITTLPDRPARRERSPLATDTLRPLTLLRQDDVGPADRHTGETSSATMLTDAPHQGTGTELQTLVQAVSSLDGGPARRIWLPPLPTSLTLAALSRVTPGRRDSQLPQALPILGLVDLPRAQRQEPLLWDYTGVGGNLGVAGAPRTGKSTLLTTLVLALVKEAKPDQAQFYCLDLGGGGLFALEGLPHVGAIVGPGEGEAANRLVQDMRSLVSERAARRRATAAGGVDDRAPAVGPPRPVGTAGAPTSGPTEPEVFVVVDNIGMLRQSAPELELELSALATTGLHQGVHVVVSANRWYDIRPQLLDALGTKLELRLGDPAETLSKRDAAKALPVDRPGRGVTRDGDQFQLALPSWSLTPGPDGEAVALLEAVSQARAGAGAARAPRVAALPESVDEDAVSLLAAQAGSAGVNPAAGFLVGVSEFRSSPAQVDLLARGAHLCVYGDGGSGRTTVVARALRDTFSRLTPDELTVHLVDPARGLIDFGEAPHVASYVTSSGAAEKLARELADELSRRLPPEGATVAELRDRQWRGPTVMLVVDDYDLLVGAMGSPMAPLAEVVAQAASVGLHVICARRVAGSQRTSFEPFSQRLRELRPTALVLSGSPDEGVVAGSVKPQQMPPGRGWLLSPAGRAHLVQCCLPAVTTDRASGARA